MRFSSGQKTPTTPSAHQIGCRHAFKFFELLLILNRPDNDRRATVGHPLAARCCAGEFSADVRMERLKMCAQQQNGHETDA